MRILGNLTGDVSDVHTINNMMVLMSFLIFLREVIFFKYVVVVFLSLLSMLLYILMFEITQAIKTPVMLGEFVLLLGSLVLL